MKNKDEILLEEYKSDIDKDMVLDLIGKCAYFKSKNRDSEDGYELQNWLEAEQEILKQQFYRLQDAS
jgi:hypothetical protein